MGHDDPTRQIPTQQQSGQAPGTQREVVRETSYAAADPTLAHQELLDRVRSLQTSLAIVAVLAVAALGVALWTLLSEDEDSGRAGASAQQVNDLEDRVDSLEDRIDDRATKSSVEELRGDVERLEGDVEEARSNQGDDDTQQAVDDLRGDVDELSQRVDELAQQQQEQSEQGTTTTG